MLHQLFLISIRLAQYTLLPVDRVLTLSSSTFRSLWFVTHVWILQKKKKHGYTTGERRNNYAYGGLDGTKRKRRKRRKSRIFDGQNRIVVFD